MPSEPTAPPTPRSWLPTAVALLGVASLVVLVASNRIRQRVVDEEMRLELAVSALQIETATIHLWLEEYLAGDTAELERIRQSRDRIEELERGLEERYAAPLRRAQVDVSEIEEGIDRFLERSTSRIEQHDQIGHRPTPNGAPSGVGVGVGSPTDREYDEIYEGLMSHLTATRGAIDASLSSAEARADLVSRALLLSWALVTALAAGGLWWHERRRRSAEAALRESQEQLFQAQKMQAVGRLAGGIAHDINNYLGAITAHSELVRMKPEDTKRTIERMRVIESTVDKASSLIQQLLAFSRKQPIRPVVVNLNGIAQELMPMIGRLIGDEITLAKRFGRDLWNTRIDRSQAEQIIVNLVINARDAMPAGGELTVETRNLSQPPSEASAAVSMPQSECVVLAIEDEGPGIDVGLRERVFEPFFSTKTEGSSGLGLATVYAILEQNGGGVRIGDAASGGARVEIFLPRTLDAVADAVAERSSDLTTKRSLKILLVEDNETLRDATQDALTGLGHSVLAAENGVRALEALAHTPDGPELLVTDVVMPQMGGKELAERLVEEYPALRVLFVSGYSDDIVLRHGIAQGSIELLQKPYTLAELVQRIEKISA